MSFQAAVAAQRSARAVARGALLAGGAQGEGAHAGRGHGRQHTDTIPAGYLVVKAQWLRLEQRECEGKLRSYTLLEAETLIIVNHMVRLAGLRFSPGRPCGPPAEERAREALYWPTDALLARGGRAAVKTYFGGVDLCKNVC